MSPIPDREPRLDRIATQLTGWPREDLSGLAVRQPFRCAGPWLGPAAVALLRRRGSDAASGPDRPGLSRFRARANRGAITELERAGLADAEGRVTDEGRRTTAPLRETERTLHLETVLGGRRSDCTVTVGRSGEALVLAGPSAHQQVLADSDVTAISAHRQLDVVAAGEASALLATWLGVGPSWFRPGAPLALPHRVVDARLADRHAPPPDDAPGPADLWERPWMGWSIRRDWEPAATFVNAGSAGQFAVRRSDDDHVQLERVPARNVYRYLVAQATTAEPVAA